MVGPLTRPPLRGVPTSPTKGRGESFRSTFNPHPEEGRRPVSKDGPQERWPPLILRDAMLRIAPQDEDWNRRAIWL